MQLFTMGSDTKYRVFFNELESKNIVKSLGKNNISIRNIDLCSYIEKALPELYKDKTAGFVIYNPGTLKVLNIICAIISLFKGFIEVSVKTIIYSSGSTFNSLVNI